MDNYNELMKDYIDMSQLIRKLVTVSWALCLGDDHPPMPLFDEAKIASAEF